MGDMADMIAEQAWDDYFEARKRRTDLVCNRCSAPNLRWGQAFGKWRLFRADGIMHSCVVRKKKEIKVDKKFYILWNPDGQTPPTVRFKTYEEAAKVAEAMQKRIGLGTMYILQAVQSFSVVQKSKWEGLK